MTLWEWCAVWFAVGWAVMATLDSIRLRRQLAFNARVEAGVKVEVERHFATMYAMLAPEARRRFDIKVAEWATTRGVNA